MSTPAPGRILTLLTLAVGFVAAPPAGLAAQEAGETIRVCTFPAQGFWGRDAQGAPSGLEYDLLTSFAAASKSKIAFEDTALFDQLLKDTETGKCQIGAATITVTDERKAHLAFSTPYFPTRVVMVQRTSTEFSQPGDLAGRRVAVVSGTLSIGLVKEIPGVRMVTVDSDDAAFESLQKGGADALACDSAVVLHYLSRDPGLGIAFPMGERSFFAFALPQGSKLLGPLNEHLQALARSGAFKKLLATHFGEENAELLADDVAQVTAKP